MLLLAGVDFLGIDIEHSTINQDNSQRIIAACQAMGIPCLPRVASHNAESIRIERIYDNKKYSILESNFNSYN